MLPSYFLFYTLYSETTPMTLVVQPLTTSPSNVTVQRDYSKAVAGVSESFTLKAYDIYGNLQIHQSDVFTLAFYIDNVVQTVSASVVPQSNGVYTATYTLTFTGEYSIVVNVQPNGLGSNYLVTSISISWSDTTTDPQKTTLIGTGSTNAVTDNSFFTVKLYDTQGNPRTTGGDTVNAGIYSGTVSVGSSWVTDNDDGTYKVEYQVDLAGTYTAMVVVNGDTANNKTATVTLIAGNGDPQLSTFNSQFLKYNHNRNIIIPYYCCKRQIWQLDNIKPSRNRLWTNWKSRIGFWKCTYSTICKCSL